MKNSEIAKIFYLISEYLYMDEMPFKPQAYQKAAGVLENLEKDVGQIYLQEGKKGLKEIPSIGEAMASRIIEYLETGKIKYYEDLKKSAPIDIETLTSIEGMGPKRIKVLYKKLGIKNLKDLEKAAKTHKIASLFGFGEKTEKNILEGIEFVKKSKGRFLLGEILPVAEEIYNRLKTLKEIEKVDIVGSLRRRKETIGDVDFLIISKNPEKVMDFFVSLPGIVKVWGKGSTKSSVRLKEGFDVDVRVIEKKSYGAALQYFTGSKEHNIALRKIAISKGLKLNEYGLFRGNKMIAGCGEEDIYKALGMTWIPPEIREDQGEMEAAFKGDLPELIEYKDIKGDLHCHSDWTGGEHSIFEMAQKAIDMNYEYLGMADHTKFLKIERGLDERQLLKQRKEIDELNEKLKIKNPRFKILQGAETNILKSGSIDINDDALKKLDYAIAGIHSNFKMSKNEMTERMIKAIKNPNVDIISHPTGRLIKKREEYQIDFDKVVRAAKESGTILEINSSPQRLDLNDFNIRRCKEEGTKMIINTDAHHKEQMKHIELGIAQARRGWAEKEDVINTQSLEKLLSFF